MKHYKSVFVAFFALIVFGTPWFVSMYPKPTKFIDNIFSYVGKSYLNYSATFFQEGITVLQLQDKYNLISQSSKKDVKKIKVLIVPGHEPNFGGTEYGGLKERDLNVDLAENLKGFLQNNSHYEVVMARDKKVWNPDLDKYFTDNWEGITDFIKQNKAEMTKFLSNGSMKVMGDGIVHNDAPQKVAVRLFGINKWTSENGVDMAIHIHFNDHRRSNTSIPGKYSGFTIYVPEQQYSNSTTTKAIAESVFKRLAKYNAVSNLPKEDDGVVETQDLIAIGSANTLDAPSMLIEYGYIYEPQFTNKEVRDLTLKDLAFQTYLGIQDFFGSGNDYSLAYDTLILPYLWKGEINKSTDNTNDILALQTALMTDGVYPPRNKSKNDCPRTGKFGPCTLEALNNFQNKHSIKNERDIVGAQTQKALNGLYSVQIR